MYVSCSLAQERLWAASGEFRCAGCSNGNIGHQRLPFDMERNDILIFSIQRMSPFASKSLRLRKQLGAVTSPLAR